MSIGFESEHPSQRTCRKSQSRGQLELVSLRIEFCVEWDSVGGCFVGYKLRAVKVISVCPSSWASKLQEAVPGPVAPLHRFIS